MVQNSGHADHAAHQKPRPRERPHAGTPARLQRHHRRNRRGQVHHPRRAQPRPRRTRRPHAHPQRRGKLLGRGGLRRQETANQPDWSAGLRPGAFLQSFPTRRVGDRRSVGFETFSGGKRPGAVRGTSTRPQTHVHQRRRQPPVRQRLAHHSGHARHHRRMAGGHARPARPSVAAASGQTTGRFSTRLAAWKRSARHLANSSAAALFWKIGKIRAHRGRKNLRAAIGFAAFSSSGNFRRALAAG